MKVTKRRGFMLPALWRKPLVQAFLSDWITLASALFLAIIILASVFAPGVAPHNPIKQHLDLRFSPPFTATNAGYFVLGADHLGRDVFSRIIYGSRISLTLGFAGALASGVIGVFLGLVSGYFKGKVDDVISRIVDLFMAFPALLLLLMVLYVLGPGFRNMIIVFAIGGWTLYCRISRGVTLSLREQPFIDSARVIGCTDGRIIVRHILPNVLSPVLTIGAMHVASVILAESTLSFLGMGIQPPESSWGLMLAEGRDYIVLAWWTVTFPGLAILFTALTFNLVSVWLRAVSDPLQRWRYMKLPKKALTRGSL
ncbi:MAG: ABC transporter permease [Chloroflexi bacterium]|nr:ABC transporter permease [Chloroflexota bacterium]